MRTRKDTWPAIDRVRRAAPTVAVIVGLTIAAATTSLAQEPVSPEAPGDSAQSSGGAWIPIPFYFYTPETTSAFGIAINALFRVGGESPDSRPSVFRPVFIYTLKKQVVASLRTDTYFGDGQHRLLGELAYLKFPNTFWGIGNNAPDSAEEDFTPRLWSALFEFHEQLRPGLYMGGLLHAANRTLVETVPGGLLATLAVPGAADGSIVGVGGIVALDNRDNIVYPRSGGFQQLRIARYDGMLGSDYDFTSYSLDLRRFVPLGDRAVLALRGVAGLTTGQPPFELLPQLGGESLLRGYYGGRYRDRDMIGAQAELRTPVWWRLGIVAFVEVGQVAPRLADFAFSELRRSYGMGFRFLFDRNEGLNIKADFGFAPGSSGFYLGVGETF